jgi:hypothetical protein
MRSNTPFATLVVLMLSAAPVWAQATPGPLGSARDLYASARYDEALAVLDTMRTSEPEARKSIEQYRSLCLLALGRASEAETAIAAVVTADPLYRPTEASPRVRAAFTEVRQRLLPAIATSRYAAAKALYDRKDYAGAEQAFRGVMALLDDADMNGRLADVRVLASGFLELSAKMAAPPRPAPKPEPAAPPPPPAAPAPQPQNKIFVAEDPGVRPPVAVKQEMPRVPSAIVMQARERGLVEVIIDEQGRVIGATLRMSVHPQYDTQLMVAARDWKYTPATFNGRPVKFRKLIQIAIKR